MSFEFIPPDGYRNMTDFPTKPANETEFRNSMQTLLDQIRDFLNNSGFLPATGGQLSGDLIFQMLTGGLTAGIRFGDGTGWKMPIENNDGTKVAHLKDDGNIYLTTGEYPAWHTGNNTFNINQTGYLKLQNNWIIQWGLTFNVPGGSSAYNILFPLTFPNAVFMVVPSVYAGAVASCSAAALTASQFSVRQNGAGPEAVAWVAIGY